MPSLDKPLRNQLERTVKDARDVAETAVRSALEQLGVGEANPPPHLSNNERDLRRRLRIHGRQLGDAIIDEPTALAPGVDISRKALAAGVDISRRALAPGSPGPRKGTQTIDRLIDEVAYEHWHRMLFARFLAENNLLMYDEESFQFSVSSVQQDKETENRTLNTENLVAISMDEAEDLAQEHGLRNKWELAAQVATSMLPQIFRVDSPVFEIPLPPEHQQQLEKLISGLPVDVFTASDSLGWTYQFWQARRKEQVNESGVKIGARELPSVTQLFTEDYMVDFLLDNTLGAWHAGKVLAANPKLAEAAQSEQELRNAVSLPGCPWTYLRFINQPQGVSPRLPTDAVLPTDVIPDQQPDANALRLIALRQMEWLPAAGTFDGWPKTAQELKCLDPCMGSGHFVVAMFERLVALRLAEEGLDEAEAVKAVIRDNLFGLEIDPRCTQIAAFNLALAAWRRIGYCTLPAMNLACSGLAPNVPESEWLALAGDNEKLQGGMERLYRLFEKAPVLGSLINPRADKGDLLVAAFHELQPLLEKAVGLTSPTRKRGVSATDDPRLRIGLVDWDDTAHEMAVTARGLAKAAEILAGQFTLVATNVPYLGVRKQDDALKAYCAQFYRESKTDLASCFVERCLASCVANGSAALVTPQNWLFLAGYKLLRRRILSDTSLDFIARLGSRAFETITGEVVNVAMLVYSRLKPHASQTFSGIDVSHGLVGSAKAQSLCEAGVSIVNQHLQSSTADARITLEDRVSLVTLEDFATHHQGLSTGDNPRFRYKHWEVPRLSNVWAAEQSTVESTMAVGGRTGILKWEEGEGELWQFGRENVKVLHNVDRRGEEAWGKIGVAVSQMGDLPVTLFGGEKFDTNTAVLIPKNADHLPALWAYCSSQQFGKNVREIDQSLKVTNASLVKVSFDFGYWEEFASEKYEDGLPLSFSSDPTQWLFNGHPAGADQPLHVAVARLVGYQWPRQTGSSFLDCPALPPDGLETLADADGIVCIPPVRGETGAADRLLNLLVDAYKTSPMRKRGSELDTLEESSLTLRASEGWSTDVLSRLLADAGFAGKSLDTWLRDGFFEQHCQLFHQRPFIWHVWDGLRDGFAALVNYHKLDRKNLEMLIHTYLGDWINRQTSDAGNKIDGAEEKLAAAHVLKQRLELILAGEAPYDIFVRWKPLHEQAVGWEPDLNDGVRMNIRPFLSVPDVKVRGAGVLRVKPKIKWEKDRGKEPKRSKEDFPWFWAWDGTTDFEGIGTEPTGDRFNDCHYKLGAKHKARETKK